MAIPIASTENLHILTNIAAMTLLSPRDYFLASMETWLATPKISKSQWVIILESIPESVSGGTLNALANSVTNVAASFGLGSFNKNEIQRLEGTTGDNDGWAQTLAGSLLGGVAFQNIIGCIFASGVNIPELDANSPQDTSLDNNGGFRKGTVLQGRNGYSGSLLEISFRETNLSFADLVIKPWSLLVSHYGLIARPTKDKKNIKTNILILEYAKTYQKITQIPSKVWQFNDCAPVKVDGEKLDYEASDQNLHRTSQWVYKDYTIRNNLYVPIYDFLNKSSFNNVLNKNIF